MTPSWGSGPVPSSQVNVCKGFVGVQPVPWAGERGAFETTKRGRVAALKRLGGEAGAAVETRTTNVRAVLRADGDRVGGVALRLERHGKAAPLAVKSVI